MELLADCAVAEPQAAARMARRLLALCEFRGGAAAAAVGGDRKGAAARGARAGVAGGGGGRGGRAKRAGDQPALPVADAGVCAAAAGALVAAGEVAEGLGLFCRASEMARTDEAGPDGSGSCAARVHASLQATAARLAQQLLAAGRAVALAPLLRLLSAAGVERLSCAALLSCLIDSLVRPWVHSFD
jgi:hypothetical protein